MLNYSAFNMDKRVSKLESFQCEKVECSATDDAGTAA